jgi:hypothetical protein
VAHDALNTRGGEFGFSIEFADGGKMTERDGTWDDVPAGRPIRSVALAHLGTGVDFWRLQGFREFFFSNEGVDVKGGSADLGDGTAAQQVTIRTAEHTAKILGGVNSDGSVVETCLIFTREGPRKLDVKKYGRGDCRFVEAAFRRGAEAS